MEKLNSLQLPSGTDNVDLAGDKHIAIKDNKASVEAGKGAGKAFLFKKVAKTGDTTTPPTDTNKDGKDANADTANKDQATTEQQDGGNATGENAG